MAYTKTAWTDEVPGEDPVTYDIEGVAMGVRITPHVAPTAGTPVNATNLNKIEEGVEDAHIAKRQGGSATVWSTAGATTYTPVGQSIQVGAIAVVVSGGAGSSTITFPTAFAYAPIVLLTVAFNNVSLPARLSVYAIIVTKEDCSITVSADGGASTWDGAYALNWLAIGPAS